MTGPLSPLEVTIQEKDAEVLVPQSWMTNADYLAQISHALAGYATMVTTGLFARSGFLWLAVVFGLFTLYATVKEFWYDLKYELPKQTVRDSLLDFFMYELGLVMGTVVVDLSRTLGG